MSKHSACQSGMSAIWQYKTGYYIYVQFAASDRP